MRAAWILLLCSLPSLAAVSGTVVNRTTGQPLPNASVGLYSLQQGFELVAEAKSDAQGKFSIDRQVQGPSLLRATHEGVTYNLVIQPGASLTGLTLDVYEASGQPGAAKVSKHMLMLQPVEGQVQVNETFIVANDGKTAWNDPANGTIRFFLPPGAGGKAQATATPPGGLPISASVLKTDKANVFGIDFAIKPGETRIDVVYAVPHEGSAPYEGKIVTRDDNTYLIAPNGVTLTGDNLNDLGVEPQTQARIYGLNAPAYKVEFSGQAVAAADDTASEDASGPQIEIVPARVFGYTWPIIGLGLAVLGIGFAILYRAQEGSGAKEANERGRR